jgi:uncharacterized delta-60 repeat protein
MNFLLLLSLFTAARAAGEVDPTFNPTIQRFAGETGNSMAVQPDGKIVVGGNFTLANFTARSAVARFNADGTLDTSFDASDIIGFTYGHIVNKVKLQPDGKIIIAGQFTSVGGVPRTNLARLNTDGSVDTSFANVNVTGQVNDIEILPDGRILLAGAMTVTGGVIHNRLSRLNANGTQDTTFNNIGGGPDISDAAVAPDGRIFIGGINFFNRYDANGGFEFFYTLSGEVNNILFLPSGQLLLGGTFTVYNGFSQGRIARVNFDGTLDTSFNTNGIGFNGFVEDTALTADGKIIAAGNFTTYNGVSRPRVARLNADGSLDTGFTYTYVEPGTSLADVDVLSNGSVLVLYRAFSANTPTRRGVVKTFADGAVDAGFNVRFGTFGTVRKIFYQADGKILVGGEFDAVGVNLRQGVMRLNPDGTRDPNYIVTFTPIGGSYFPVIFDIAQQPDGKFIVAGEGFSQANGHPTAIIARLNPDGSVDTSFTSALLGTARSVAIEPDGKILIGGVVFINNMTTHYILRLNSNGTVDNTFNPNIVNGSVNRIIKQPDGKILIGGAFTTVLGVPIRGIARLNANGSLDNTFNPPGGANNTVFGMALLPDGKVLIGGAFSAVNGVNRAYLARLNQNGTLDTGFTPNPNYTVHDIAVQPDGKILIGGEFTAINNASSSRYGRLNADGTLDTTFNVGSGANIYVYDIELAADGKILLGGNFTRVNNQSRVGIVRLLNLLPPKALFDYDGDGKSDLSVFRPSAGAWYIARPTGIPSQNFDAVQFGASGDLIVPADYDGDGKTDVAVWRPSDGTWYLLQSSAGFRAAQFGANGDIPVPGDFDGDGKANLAVFRPSTESWYIARPTGIPAQNFETVLFGANGDKPIAGADFDGDGKADVAMFRPSTGDWYRLNSSNGQFVGVHFGTAEDKPVAADYDGDRKTDLAVWRPSDGVWYRINSGTDTFTATQFGIAADKPVPADYDGDGKTDLGVFRPSDGVWYLLKSTSGFAAAQFGASGDVPTPNAFVR